MVFFIADTHFGHRAICKYRTEFSSPQEHDEYIISRINSVVKKAKHQLWLLGDICIKNSEYDFTTLLKRLNGTLHIITGNHDYLPAYEGYHVANALTKKYKFWLSHCPIHPEELRGVPNISGHVHYKTIDDPRYLNVCCEAINYTPINLDDVRSTFKERGV